jgi:hypothetical protein
MRFGRTAGTTNTGGRQLFQTLETADSVRFAGKTVTFSFYARAGANYSQTGNILQFSVVSGTGTDQIYYSFTGSASVISTTSVTLTTSWQRFTATGTVATNATQLATTFLWSPTGTAGAADFFEVTGVQLEEGSVATPYSRQNSTIQGELAACQRYYVRFGNDQNYTFIGAGNADSTTKGNIAVPLPVTMRVPPTTIDFSTLCLQNNGGSSIIAVNSLTFSPAAVNGKNMGVAYPTVASGLTQGTNYMLIANGSTNGYLAFGAEL